MLQIQHKLQKDYFEELIQDYIDCFNKFQQVYLQKIWQQFDSQIDKPIQFFETIESQINKQIKRQIFLQVQKMEQTPVRTLQQRRFDQKVSLWSNLINKPNKQFKQLEQTNSQIDQFVKEHTNPQQSGHPALSKSQLQRVKNLRKSIKSQMKKYKDFKYYFNAKTKILFENIRSQKNLAKLYANRLKAIKIFEKNTNSNAADKALKLHKLQKLIALADRRIQRMQSNLVKPLSLTRKLKQATSQYMRQINFFLIVAWIISFLLANKDPSKCLDSQIVGKINFRHWLWANGSITLYLTVMLVFWDILDNLDQDKPKETEPTHDQIYQEGNQDHLQKSINVKINQSPEKFTSLNNKQEDNDFCRVISFVLLGIGIITKFFWIFFGIIIFLNQVDFDACGDNVLNYCSLQFLAFFSFTTYGLLSFILTTIKSKFKRSLKPYPTEHQLKKNSQNQKLQAVEPDIRLSIEGNIDDLQDVLKRLVVWTLIGWVYDFVLYRKDHSGCLDERYDNFSLTYRDWLLIDGITSLVTFLFSILLIVVFILKHQHFMIWQIREEFFEIKMSWMCNNLVLTVFFGLILVFKTAWLIVGVVILCLNVNLGSCSGNIPNFLVAYFTESVYVVIFSFVSVAKGYRKRKSLREYKKIEDEIEQHLMDEQKSPQKKKEELENMSQLMIKEEQKSEKADITQLQINPMIIRSSKKLLNQN